MTTANSADTAKRSAAVAAAALVEDGMVLGLGTGSTAAHFVRALGARVREGLRVQGSPTSRATEELARAEGVPLIAPDDALRFDLAVDGADEVDPQRRLIKGAGGALLREKMIAAAADRFIVIVDAAKVVDTLGAFKLPIEVAPFAVGLTQARLRGTLDDLGYAHATLRLRTDANGTPIITDGGNPILDCECAVISDAEALACALDSIPGVFEHGLFLGMTHQVLVGDASGVVRSF